MNERTDKVAAAVREAGAAGLVVQLPINLGYLAPYEEDGHERFLALFIAADGKVTLIAPGLSENQAKRAGFTDVRTWKDGEDPLELVAGLGGAWSTGKVLVDDYLKAAHLLGLQQVWPSATFERGGPVIGELMRKKDVSEIALMKRAAQIADDAWLEVKPTIRAGETERDVSERLAAAMKARGGKPTFSIVAAGPMGAEPHHLSDDTVLRDGDVLICDFGCLYGGYNSDITRTVALGSASDESVKVYGVVLRAHQAGVAAAKPGASRNGVDKAARDVILSAGYGEFFNHRLGHGIGKNGHEEPNLTPGDERSLQVGDCFSIEPGIYLPGRFGVRLENIYTLTDSGAVSFNAEIESSLEVVGVPSLAN